MSRQLLTWGMPVVLFGVSAMGLSQTAAERPASAPAAADAKDERPARLGAPGEGGAREQGTAPAPQRSAGDVLGEMLKPRRGGGERELTATEPPLVDKTSGPGSVAPGAPTLTVLREGTPIVNRVGRLTFGRDGAPAEFTFDADGQALRDPPLIVLPNLKLMLMEDSARDATREPRFRVSGVVTEYRGRNYLLLEKVSVPSQSSQQVR